MTYDLKSVKFPKLGTSGLRALVALAENGLVGPPLINKLMSDGGLTRIREIAPDDAPTFYPVHAADDPGVPPLVPASGPIVPPRGFRFPGVADFSAAYRDGTSSPEKVAECFLEQLDRSERGDRPLKAFIAVRRDDVMAQAKESAHRWRAGAPLSAFDGVPVAVKDEIDQAGYPTTVGTKFLGAEPVSQDATIVARLRSAGALLVGKANMHEIGINVTGLNPHHGTTRNPYNDAFHTGGSSSGPATVVASGLAPVAIGADGGGSIRIPSAFCGLVGIKPTFGRLSEHGAFPLCWTVAYLGPMTGSVVDCRMTYELMAGADPHDPHTAGAPPVLLDPSPPASLDGVRLGVYWPWFRHASPEVAGQCESLVRSFVDRGATLHEVEISELDDARVAHIVTILGEMSSSMRRYYAAHRTDFSLDARLNLASAFSFSDADYVNAQRIRTRARTHWARAFADVDAIVTPAAGQTAPRINPAAQPDGESDLSTSMEIMRFAFASNLTGHPAISFPAGYGANNLPIGLQVIGRPWAERLLFRIAKTAEQIVDRRPPARWYPLLER
jgi:Asp-tRNA(Asn)/Glu-tRNA(Gln) amidotransferase A subunit family amidase